jgi:hypothetical protein
MITPEVIKKLDEKKYSRLLNEDGQLKYAKILSDFGIHPESDIFEFYLIFSEPAFLGKDVEFDHICWFFLYSSYESRLEYFWEKRPWGVLPRNIIPLSSFSGEAVLLFDISKDHVYLVTEAEINLMLNGQFNPTWKSFNEFLVAQFL